MSSQRTSKSNRSFAFTIATGVIGVAFSLYGALAGGTTIQVIVLAISSAVAGWTAANAITRRFH